MTPRSAPSPEDNSSPEDPHNPDSRHKHGGAAPDMGRCTRYVALHPLRGGAPEQKRCIAYGSGAAPQHTRTNAELAHRTTHRHTPPCATGPYWRQDGHAAHATTYTPARPGPLRHLPHPYMRRAAKADDSRVEPAFRHGRDQQGRREFTRAGGQCQGE